MIGKPGVWVIYDELGDPISPSPSCAPAQGGELTLLRKKFRR
jgi:hypothetical protein